MLKVLPMRRTSLVQNLSDSELLELLIILAFDNTRNSRKYKGISEYDFINLAIDRVMGD